jgi:Uma2 family endonuclease
MGKLAARKPKTVPPLIEGDRMTTDEFFRRYDADKSVVRAELINGVVYVNARREIVNGQEVIVPPISGGHGRPQSLAISWLVHYELNTPGVEASAPSTVRLSPRTAPEPDAMLRILPEYGGQSVVGDDDYLAGPPELVIEVAKTSAGRDLGHKFDAYQRDGVKEYLVWRSTEGLVDWFVLKRRSYTPLTPGPDGIIRSETFPGLWLDVEALLARDHAKLVLTLQKGTATHEHAAFVAKLKAAAAKRKKK